MNAARIVITLRKWVEQNKTLVVTIFKVIAGVVAAGAGLFTLGGLITGLGTVLGGLSPSLGRSARPWRWLVKVLAALLSPIGLVVAAFAWLAAYIVYASGLGRAAMDALAQNFAALKDDAMAPGGALQTPWRRATSRWPPDPVAHAQDGVAAGYQFPERPVDSVQGFLPIDGHRSRYARPASSTMAGLRSKWVGPRRLGFCPTLGRCLRTCSPRPGITAVGFIQKAWVRLKSLFDEDINVDAEVTRINREVEQSNAGATKACSKPSATRPGTPSPPRKDRSRPHGH